MIDEFDFGLYLSLIENERYRDHYMENNDNFYTRFAFYEGLTEYKSINVIFKEPNSLWATWFRLMNMNSWALPHTINQLLYKDVEFDLSISLEGEEYIFYRESKKSKIFKRKYSEDE